MVSIYGVLKFPPAILGNKGMPSPHFEETFTQVFTSAMSTDLALFHIMQTASRINWAGQRRR